MHVKKVKQSGTSGTNHSAGDKSTKHESICYKVYFFMKLLLNVLNSSDSSVQSNSEDSDTDSISDDDDKPVSLSPDHNFQLCGCEEEFYDECVKGIDMEMLNPDLTDEAAITDLAGILIEDLQNKFFPMQEGDVDLETDIDQAYIINVDVSNPPSSNNAEDLLVSAAIDNDNVEKGSCLPNKNTSIDTLDEQIENQDFDRENVNAQVKYPGGEDVNHPGGEDINHPGSEDVNHPGGEDTEGTWCEINVHEADDVNEDEDVKVGNGVDKEVEHGAGRASGDKNSSIGNSDINGKENGNGKDGKEERNTDGNKKAAGQGSCDHYKRGCLVWFGCCKRHYPCHRCHNNAGICSKKNVKAKDATLLKCLSCSEIQRFTENSQHCVKCAVQFAEYYCHYCRQLTDFEKKPYHCSKCGICRVQSDRSYHCDTCNVCLDISLRDKHQCRENSAHEPCCICLEDAFTGCQVLPCGHKVHKECARIMIRRGMRQCPKCNQSFAHLLRRAPKS